MTIYHIPVLCNELLNLLKISECKLIFDCTCGTGGHSLLFLQNTRDCKVVGIDFDEESLAIATERLKEFGERFIPIKKNFKEIEEVIKDFYPEKPDAILLDLGVSSYQLLHTNRGLSFQKDAPLDMRMSKNIKITASDILNSYSEASLTKIFSEYGEEKKGRYYTKRIIEFRRNKKILKVSDLFEALNFSHPEKWRKAHHRSIHPLTKIFQALRIAVNDELSNLSSFLLRFDDFLNRDGKLAIVSYHSLEDRIVKNAFKQKERENSIKILTKKCVRATVEEIKENRRSRSARLRVCVKI